MSRLCSDQIKILKLFYSNNANPSNNEIAELAKLIDSEERKLKRWFRNRRMIVKMNDGEMPNEKYNFSPYKSLLMDSFNRDIYPDASEINRLAKLIQCDAFKIRNWFTNQRRLSKMRKENNEDSDRTEIEQSREEKTNESWVTTTPDQIMSQSSSICLQCAANLIQSQSLPFISSASYSLSLPSSLMSSVPFNTTYSFPPTNSHSNASLLLQSS